jgi:hypothetical protein
METVTLRAHFEGEQIVLDEPFKLEPNTELIVIVVPRASAEEREDWTRLALASLARLTATMSRSTHANRSKKRTRNMQ